MKRMTSSVLAMLAALLCLAVLRTAAGSAVSSCAARTA